MREFKFDMNVILRNCERFGVKVEKGTNNSGVMMNGKPFNVTKVMNETFNELELNTNSMISHTTTRDYAVDQGIQNFESRNFKVSLGESKTGIQKKVSFSEGNAQLNAA